MAIVKTVYSASNFRDEFVKYGRGNSFSYAGLEVLYDYLDQLSDDIGEPIELDPVAIDCDFAEYDLDELQSEYGYLLDDNDDFDTDDLDCWVELLQNHTTVLVIDSDSLIVQVF